MIPYYIMVAIPIMFNMFYGRKNEISNTQKRQKVICWSFFCALLILLVLRHKSVGCDIETYLSHFKQVSQLSIRDIFFRYEDEQGFWLLNRAISIFTKNEQWFIAIMAIICVLPVANLYAKESEKALLSISIFLIVPNFNIIFSGLRQAIALAIVALSFKYVKEKKLFKFILVVALAFFFHKSALVALLIYPFYHMNITRAKLLVFIPVISLVLIYNKPIFEFLIQFLGEYGERYEYEETSAYTMIILFSLFVLFAYVASTNEKMDKDAIGIRNLSVIALTLQIFALANPVAMRMNYYYIMFLPLLIPKIINRCSERNKTIYELIGIIMLVFFIIYYLYKANMITDTLDLYPYKPFWK